MDTTTGSNGDEALTIEKVMQHIERLQKENEDMRQQVEGERTQWLADEERRRRDLEAEHERLRKESAESRQRLEESLRQQE